MKIGITETYTEDIFENYVEWVRRCDPSVEIVKLSHSTTQVTELKSLSGLLLSGGGDVDPRYYHQDDRTHYARDIRPERDAFEFDLIDHALDVDMPILGVCRGIQIMNVYLGGSLILDLVASRFDDHSDNGRMVYHPISLMREDSILQSIVQQNECVVNSFHHQAIDRLGRGLVITAQSHDGVVEAVEWAVKTSMPFLFLVQWHPERELDCELSKKIIRRFLNECFSYKQ